MRPIKLHMEYFGPFKGETIDFKHADGQMFLISGKTGSGKTMIFDAITFSLYGQTSTTDRDEYSVRSQFASDNNISKVSLEFIVGKNSYTVERELSFSKEGRKSKVPSKAALYADDGSVIESSVTGVTGKVIDIIQLTADQFRQILILPQGEFKKLLVSTSEDKQKILRTLFQTERFVDFENRLKELEKTDRTELHQLEAKIGEQLSTLEDNEEHPGFNHQIESLKTKIRNVKKEAGELEKSIASAREKRNGLQEELKQKHAHNDKVGQLEKLKEHQTALNANSRNIKVMEDEISDYNRVKTIDFELRREAELKDTIDGLEKRENGLKIRYQDLQKEYDRLTEKMNELKKNEPEILDTEKYITRNERFLTQKYKKLPEEISAVNDRLKTLSESTEQLEAEQRTYSQELGRVTATNDEADELTARKHSLELQQNDFKVKLDDEKTFMGYDKKLAETESLLKSNKENREQCESFLEELKSSVQSKYAKEDQPHIEHLLGRLAVGDACPVCQSTVETIPDGILYLSEDEEQEINSLNEQLELLESEGESLEDDSKLYERLLNGMERHSYDDLSKSFSETGEEIVKVSDKISSVKKALERKDVLDKKISKQSTQIQQYKFDQEKNNDRLAQLKELLEEFNTETSFDDYDGFENHMVKQQEAVRNFKLNKEQLEQRQGDLNKEITVVSQSLKHSADSIKENQATIVTLSEVLDEFLHREPFLDRNELRQILRQTDIEAKEKEVRTFHQEKSSTERQMDEIEKTLVQTDYYNTVEDEEEIKSAEDEIEQFQKELAVLNNNISQYDRVLSRVSEYIGEYEEKKEHFEAVSDLVQKVGGNNESRVSLERYVLTYFLEKILNIANERLLDMTNHRYALVRSRARISRKTGLDIEVFDYYNNSARHISSLSGGETFQASLSLALALSEAVQQEAGGISLDTMFIDEGFGTLDKETLEIAISTLIDLQSNGKTIGIISHVSELKERLNCILEVTSTDEISKADFNF